MAVHRAPQPSGRWPKLALITVLLLVLAVALTMVLLNQPETDVRRDSDLCPVVGAAANQGALLVDLRKPLGAGGRQLVGDVLRDVTVALPADTELSVYTLTGNATAPRQLLRRFCKPYANSELAIAGAKEGAAAVRDCTDLPAQLPARLRGNAQRFCVVRAEVAEDLGRAASRPLAIPVPSAFLVEAIEETALSFAEPTPATGARRFFVLSDMLQHAPWFSHVERGMAGWGFSDFIYLRETAASSVGPRPAPLTDVGVTIFYLPRIGWTEAPRPRMTHTAFWTRYFLDAMGAEPELRTLTAVDGYEMVPLMNQLSEAEKIAQERERLKRERERLEAAMALDEERRQAEAEAQAVQQAERQAAEQRAAEQRAAEQRAAERQAAEQRAAEQRAAVTEPATPAGEPVPEVTAPEASPTLAEPAPQVVGASAARPDADDDEFCATTLLAEYRNTNAYPHGRRINFGSATMVVEFELDDQGQTVDDSVQVVAEASQSARPNYFDVFSSEAVNLARRWEFQFDPNETNCVRRQTMQVTVEFQF